MEHNLFHIAICEDNLNFLHHVKNTLETELKQRDILCQYHCFASGEALISTVEKENARYDIIFFDIDLPGISGIQGAKAIRQLDPLAIFIFVTSLHNKVYEIFELDIFYFVRKSHFEIEIIKVLKLLVKKLRARSIHHKFKTREGFVNLYPHEILYFERNNKYIEIHTLKTMYTIINYSLKELKSNFVDKSFYEIHKGILVNLSHIKYLHNNTVILTTGDQLPVSRRNYGDLKKDFFKNLS
nr:LytTR family DNA-binding domain-containing protein [Alkalibaculum bacchi]